MSADTRSDNGALSSLNLAGNSLNAEGIRLLAGVLKENTIMTELNISNNSATWDRTKHGEMSGIIALADAIPDMRALSKLTFGGDKYPDRQLKRMVTPEPAVLEIGMTEADFSNKHLGAAGAIIISAWISKDNGALAKLDISCNCIGAEQEGDLQRICAAGGIELDK
jgi:hypothetical protein